MQVTEKSLYKGIEQAKVGNNLYDISAAIQSYVEARGFHIVKRFVGHGIGTRLHEKRGTNILYQSMPIRSLSKLA